MRPLRLGMQLGLFQLSLGILGVLILGLLNRLLIQDIQLPAVLASLALMLMLWAGAEPSIPLLRTAVGLFGLSLGVCMNACLTLMFSFVQPGRTGFLLGVWGAGYAYSCGLATISGGGLLTLLKAWNGGDLFAAYGGVFALQMVCFLGAALMTRRLDVVDFRNTVKTRFSAVMEISVD